MRFLNCNVRRRLLAAAAVVSLLASACHGTATDNRHREGDIEVMRLERVIMDSEAAQLESALQQFADTLASPLLTLLPDDPQFMAMVMQYRSDSTMLLLDSLVRQRYGSLTWLERALTDGVARLAEQDPAIRLRKVATYIGSGGYPDRVHADRESGTVTVAIDQYVAPMLERYGYLGDPLYQVHLSDSAYLATDCLAALAQEYIAMPPEPWSLLDYMVAEGKELYLLDLALPRTADSIKIRYTSDQMRWMERHEEKVWATLLQNQVLFSTDVTRFHNLIDEAPKTNAFGNESAPRTVEYIGWKIVRQYMKRSGSSLHALLEETDARKILNESGYRPD